MKKPRTAPKPDSPSPAEPRVLMRDIARCLGVSHVTVSLALRDHPRISEATRQKVHAAAREMGYRPDPMLKALSHYRGSARATPVRAVLAWLNHWPNPAQLRGFREMDGYWHGAFAAAEKAGYRLEEFTWDENGGIRKLEKTLLTRDIRGILIPPHPGEIDWKEFRWEQFSTVRFGYSMPEPQVHRVASDQMGDSWLAVHTMRKRGYERIGFVGDASPTRGRFTAGFLLGQLVEIPPALRLPPLLFDRGNPQSARQKALANWLAEHRPDAILTEIATLREMLAAAGRRVPRDLGLAALSVLDGGADAGINQNPEVIGQAAVEIVIALTHRSERGTSAASRTTNIEGRWVDGKSLPVRKP